MEDLPPPGSDRRRIAIAIWVALTIIAAALLAAAVYSWTRGESRFPLLFAIILVGNVIGGWRWILERSRPDAPPRDPRREAIVRWNTWMVFSAGILGGGLYLWATGNAGFVTLLVIGGIGTGIAAWRWTVARSRAAASNLEDR